MQHPDYVPGMSCRVSIEVKPKFKSIYVSTIAEGCTGRVHTSVAGDVTAR